MITIKLILIIAGGVLTIVGLSIDNWKVAVIGNSVGISSLLFT